MNKVAYTTVNTYETLNELTQKTKNVWIVLHGIGFLSRYFLKYFDELSADENYIIAPQAPAKYYLGSTYKHVGASWLTKEDTHQEIKNVLTYLDAVLLAEAIPKECNLLVLGFSQGVSMATRWVSSRKLNCSQLILYAGGIPDELLPQDFYFLKNTETEVKVILGTTDEYLTEKRVQAESRKIKKLFPGKITYITFEGGHEIKKEIINSLV